jgi:hypothetical protein
MGRDGRWGGPAGICPTEVLRLLYLYKATAELRWYRRAVKTKETAESFQAKMARKKKKKTKQSP